MNNAKLQKIMERNNFFESEIDSAINFIEDMFLEQAKEIELNDPYATNTITRLKGAAKEVRNLSKYIYETMENDWYLTDNDCCQYMRKNGTFYELIQYVWLYTTKVDKAKEFHEYRIVYDSVDINNLDDEDIEAYISPYDYTIEDLEEKYGVDGARDLIAECVLETNSLHGGCVIAETATYGNTINGNGFVTNSGFGDGMYTCWVARNENDKVIAIEIEFIDEEDM